MAQDRLYRGLPYNNGMRPPARQHVIQPLRQGCLF